MPTTKLNLPLIENTKTADVVRDMNALAVAVDSAAGVNGGLATLSADGKLTSTQMRTIAIATPSANGLMSAADKTALDNAQKWKLTANDGTVKEIGVSNIDTITTSGEIFTSANCIGAPDNEYYKVTTQSVDGFTRTQLANRLLSNDVYVRTTVSGQWAPWKKLSHTNLLGSILLGNKLVDYTKADFVGKVSGSTTANPHVVKVGYANALVDPNGFSYELLDADYKAIYSIGGAPQTTGSSQTNGTYALSLFSFNLIEHVQRTYGAIPGATTADKVAWLKSNLSKLTFNWWGFGSSPAGNKATIQRWRSTSSAWVSQISNNTSTSSKLSMAPTISDGTIDDSGFVHFLAYADASDGTTASVINTDYVELQIELSTDIKSNLNIATTADKITIADTANYYAATHVEGALAEIGQTLAGTRTSIVTTAQQLGVM